MEMFVKQIDVNISRRQEKKQAKDAFIMLQNILSETIALFYKQ